MFKVILEKAEEPEIKLPTSAGSWKKEESFRKTSISALLTMSKPLTCVDHSKLWKIVKEMSEKVGLKLNIQKTKIMASSPITLWQIDGETMERVSDFIFLSSKITADGDCSHEIKRCLPLGRKAMTNLDSIFKSRDVTLPTKVHLVKTMVFRSEERRVGKE